MKAFRHLNIKKASQSLKGTRSLYSRYHPNCSTKLYYHLKHVNVVHHEITYFIQLFSSEVMFIVICLFGLTLSPNRLTTPNKYCLRLCLFAYVFKIITITIVYENQTITSSFTYCVQMSNNSD